MSKFVSKPETVDAVQWQTDPQFGEWRSGKIMKYFRRFKDGTDRYGVQYSVDGTYLPGNPGCAGLLVEPGQWIVTFENGRREVHDDLAFRSRFDPVKDDAEESRTLQGTAD